MSTFIFMKEHLNKYKYSIAFIFILNLTLWISSIVNTYITGSYIDILIGNVDIDIIIKFSIILILLGIIDILIGYINNIKYSKLQSNMVFDINFKVIKHVKYLPINFFNNIDSVYLNQRINADTNTVVNFLISLIIKVTIQVISFLIIFFILAKKNNTLAVVILISIPLYIILYIICEKNLYKTTLEYKENQNKFIAYMNRQLSNIPYVKLNSLFTTLDNELILEYPVFFKSLMKFLKCNYNFSSLGTSINNMFNVFLFFYGGIAIYKNKMSVGDFIIIKSYYLMLLDSIISLTSTLKTYPDAKVSFDRLITIQNSQRESNGNYEVENIYTIEVKNLKFNLGEKNIINNFNFKFYRNNVYLIKGNNGVGKSTLVKILLGLYIDGFEGEILYNDIDIKDIDLYKAREENISIVDQEPMLIYKSIYKNITQNIDRIDNSEIERLLDGFNLDSTLNLFNEKVDNMYSGGEKQKISIIRSLIKDSDLIIMDEPTSALDTNSVSYLLENINTIKNNKIIIIISHDERLEEIVDETIYISNDNNKNFNIVSL